MVGFDDDDDGDDCGLAFTNINNRDGGDDDRRRARAMRCGGWRVAVSGDEVEGRRAEVSVPRVMQLRSMQLQTDDGDPDARQTKILAPEIPRRQTGEKILATNPTHKIEVKGKKKEERHRHRP